VRYVLEVGVCSWAERDFSDNGTDDDETQHEIGAHNTDGYDEDDALVDGDGTRVVGKWASVQRYEVTFFHPHLANKTY
jgi:hypothetical protein